MRSDADDERIQPTHPSRCPHACGDCCIGERVLFDEVELAGCHWLERSISRMVSLRRASGTIEDSIRVAPMMPGVLKADSGESISVFSSRMTAIVAPTSMRTRELRLRDSKMPFSATIRLPGVT